MFEDILKTQKPLESDSFKRLLQEIGNGENAKPLRSFLIQLNDELRGKTRATYTNRPEGVQDLLHALLNTHSKITIETLKNLIEEMDLNYHDRLVDILFEPSPQGLAFFPLMSELSKMENQLLRFRIRVLEAILMKGSFGGDSNPVSDEAKTILHCLNEILYDLQSGPGGDARQLSERLSDDQFKAIRKLLSDAHVRGRHHVVGADPPLRDNGLSLEGHFHILDLIQEAASRLIFYPRDTESAHSVLEVLKANSPVPVWYSALITPDPAKRWPDTNFWSQCEAAVVLALVIDKGVEVVLTIAQAAWRQGNRPGTRETTAFASSDPSAIEAILLDQSAMPKTRNMAAGLLRVIQYAFPATRLSPTAEFYSDLFLIPVRPGLPESAGQAEFFSIIETSEKIPMVMQAFKEKTDYVRWKASEICYRTALNHPEWFTPQHQVLLLTLLPDGHAGIRSNIVGTFRVLSEHHNEGMVKVIRGISKQLSKDVIRTEAQDKLHKDLEAALATIFDSLMQQIVKLQREVQRLDARGRTLLDQIERQVARIGEEIHHEILNTRCSYLATWIDEEQYGKAKKELEGLVGDLRRIMNNLYPKDLETEGFLATMRKRLEDAKRQVQRHVPKFTVGFDYPEEITNEAILGSFRDRSHLVFLYRILLEAIVDARKHAHGTFIRVRFSLSDAGAIVIAVSDDGRGDGGPFQENVGMALMRQRAEEIGAEIEYQKTSEERGTTVVVRLPHRTGASGLGGRREQSGVPVGR